MDLGSLSASLSLDSGGFQDGLEAASNSLSSFASVAAGVFAGGSLLEGMNGIVSGLSGMVGYAVSATAGMQDFATAAGIGLGETTDAATTASGAIGGTGTSALAAADALAKYNEKVATIQQNIADVMAGANVTDAEEKFADQLSSLQQAYADKVQSINDQIAQTYEDLAERKADIEQKAADTIQNMQDSHANKMADRQEKQAYELSLITSAVTRAAKQKQFDVENKLADDSYQRQLATKQAETARSIKEQEEAAQDAADKKVATLQNQLAREAKLEQEKEDKLKEQETDEISRLQAQNAKKYALYQRELADEERSYQLSLQRRASSGGGTGGGYMSLLPKNADREISGTLSAAHETLKGILGSVQTLATTNPFPLSDIEAADRKLKTANINVEAMNPAMANFAAVSGRSLTSLAAMMDTTIHGRGMAILNALNVQAKDLTSALGRPIKNANDIAEALREIGEGTSKNTDLNNRFKGAAQAMGQTVSGQMAIVNNQLALAAMAFMGLNVVTGKPVKGGLLEILMAQLKELTSWLNSHQKEVGKFASELGKDFIAVGKVVVEVAKFIKDNWGIIGPTLLTLGIAFGIIIPILAFLIPLITQIGIAFSVGAAAAGTLGGILELVGFAISALGGPITLIGIAVAILVVLIITHWTQIKNFISGAVAFIKDVISSDLAVIQVLWTSALNFLLDAGKAWITSQEDTFNTIMKFLEDLIDGIGKFFHDSISKFMSWGTNLAKAFVDGIKNVLKDIGSVLTGPIESAFKMFKGKSPPDEGPLRDIDHWGYNIGMAWVQGFQQAVGSIRMPNIGSLSSGLGSGYGGGNYNATSNLRTTNLTMNNAFTISGDASAANMVEYLAFQSNHFGAV